MARRRRIFGKKTNKLLGRVGENFLGQAIGFGFGGAISPAVEPYVRDLTNEAWESNPSMPLSPADAATAVVQGVLGRDDAAGEAKQYGVDGDVFDWMVAITGAPPGPQELLSMLDRGIIDEPRARRGLLQSRLKPEWVDAVLATNPALLSVPDLAEMVVQGIIDEPAGAKLAAQLSYSGDQFARLVRLAGNPPGPQELLAMWQRGIIDEPRATEGLRQSRLKPEWVEQFKRLRFHPPSAAQAVNATVKERVSYAEGERIAAENGVDAEAFKLLVDEAGRPISITQGLQLLRRRAITEARFREIVARSDVKTEFTADLLHLAENLPSLAQMRAIVGTGAIGDADARDVLSRLGYSKAVVEGIIAAGHGVKLAGTRQLTQSAIVTAYKDRAISNADAAQLLGGIGYDHNDAALILGTADYELRRAYRSAVVAIVKARYLQHDIDRTTATTWLDGAGLAPAERDQLLDLWDFDIEANPHLLTLAQLTAAHKAGLIDRAGYVAYLPRLGYVEPELTILADLYAPG